MKNSITTKGFISLFAGVFALFLLSHSVKAQTMDCAPNHTAYMVQNDDSGWLTFDLVTGDLVANDSDDYSSKLNGIGYNRVDGLIWGTIVGTNNIFSTSINTGGSWTITQYAVAGLPSGNYFVGDVDDNGKLYIRGGFSTTIYVIDLTTGAPFAVEKTITMSSSAQSADWAFNITGDLYTLGNNGILYKIDPVTGAVTDLGTSNVPNCSNLFGAQYFDGDGFFYVYCNASGDIHRLDLRNTPMTAAEFDETQTVLFENLVGMPIQNDGARCASSVIRIDFGDAPDSYGTILSSDGARHGTGFDYSDSTLTSSLMIGVSVDAESDGQPGTDANNDGSDEDGISTLPVFNVNSNTYSVEVLISNSLNDTANLYAWIDLDLDGTFDENEQATLSDGSMALIGGQIPPMDTGTIVLQWSGFDLSAFKSDTTYLRIRLTSGSLDLLADGTDQDDASIGAASDGEIEDYLIPLVVCSDVSVKVFLEGPYQTSSDNMTTKLYEHHLLPGMNKDSSSAFTVRLRAVYTPFGHPYAVAPWSFTDYLGDEFGESSSPSAPGTVLAYDADVTDWVLVTVREDSILPANNVWRCAGLLHNDGTVSFPDTCACLAVDTASDYYILVEHRNHLGALSPQPAIELGGGDTLYWDFTTSDSYKPAFRVGQKEVESGVWAMFAANGDQTTSNSSINSTDRTIWKDDQNDINYLDGDFNLNVVANSEDDHIWKLNQTLTSGVMFY